MSNLPPHDDPGDQTPAERDLSRRSKAPGGGPWVWLILIVMVGLLVYAVSSML
jgi:hypothetical protein